jgi:hypothetical protein
MRSEEEIRSIRQWLKDYEFGFSRPSVLVGEEELSGEEVTGALILANWILNDEEELKKGAKRPIGKSREDCEHYLGWYEYGQFFEDCRLGLECSIGCLGFKPRPDDRMKKCDGCINANKDWSEECLQCVRYGPRKEDHYRSKFEVDEITDYNPSPNSIGGDEP